MDTLNRKEIIFLAATALLFIGLVIFSLHSPLYSEKRDAEREMAKEYLMNNPPPLIDPFERQSLMAKYQLTEQDLKATNSIEHSDRQKLLDKNPVVKILLGLP